MNTQQKLEKEINQFYQEEDISRYAAQGLLNAILTIINEENMKLIEKE